MTEINYLDLDTQALIRNIKITEKMYMNPCTGSVDTLDGWYPYTPEKDGLIEVIEDEEGEWVEVE